MVVKWPALLTLSLVENEIHFVSRRHSDSDIYRETGRVLRRFSWAWTFRRRRLEPSSGKEMERPPPPSLSPAQTQGRPITILAILFSGLLDFGDGLKNILLPGACQAFRDSMSPEPR